MSNIYEKIRMDIDKALLGAGRKAYKLTGGRIGKGMFEITANPQKIGTNVKILSENEDSVSIAKTDKNGNIVSDDFRILTTTDIHLGDDPAERKKAIGMLMKHIKATKPDLVILTGDIILSRFQHLDAIQFARFMEEVGVYWAFVFGNHEAREEKGRFKHLLMECMTSYPHCLSRQGKPELFGYVNFYINIMKSETEVQKTLFLFDSGRDITDKCRKEYDLPEDLKGYDFIKNDQMDWYRASVEELNRKYGDVKSFMYMHIPIKEYEEVIKPEANEKGEFEFTGKCEVLYGSAYEAVGSSGHNSGLFALIKDLGSTQAVFSGHDHVNDFCAIYDGVYLVYNQYDGYETYTMGVKYGWEEKKWMQGVTVTDIMPDGTFRISQRFNRMYL